MHLVKIFLPACKQQIKKPSFALRDVSALNYAFKKRSGKIIFSPLSLRFWRAAFGGEYKSTCVNGFAKGKQ